MKFPKGEASFYELGKAQEAKNIISAKVKVRTRYLSFNTEHGELWGNYIWQDSFNLKGQHVLHRYLTGDGGLIHYKTFSYDDRGNPVFEKEFPGTETSLPDTNSWIRNEYTYDKQGNIIKHKMTFSSKYFVNISSSENTFDAYGNLIRSEDEEQEQKDGKAERTEKTISTLAYWLDGDKKIVEQTINRTIANRSAKFTIEFDANNFMLKEERLVSEKGSGFKPDRLIIFNRDEKGRLSEKKLFGKNDDLFAEYTYSYAGDTVIEKYSRKDGKSSETRKYLGNQEISTMDEKGKLTGFFVYNGKGLLVKEFKEPQGAALISEALSQLYSNGPGTKRNNADTIVYEYYK